jgi:anti-sigma B factor antagonist
MTDTHMQLVEVAQGEFEVTGEIDAHSSESFASALEAAGELSSVVKVDMSGVTFMDSSGLRVLVEAQQRAEAGGPTLVLRSPSRQIVRLLDLAGLTETFEIDAPA